MRNRLLNKILILFFFFIAVVGINAQSIQAASVYEQGVGTANNRGNAVSSQGNGTDVKAGVTLDYMGRLRFLVRDRDSLVPIEGAAVEIYIPALDRYVFFGFTDSDGIYDLDVHYQKEGDDTEGQFVEEDGKIIFKGKVVFLEDSHIKWQVYKETYLPYPERGEEDLTAVKLPHQIDVYLYKKSTEIITPPTDTDETSTTEESFDIIETGSEEPDSEESDSRETYTDESDKQSPDESNKPGGGGTAGNDGGKGKYGNLPKTGIESALTLWGVGFLLCMIGLFLLILLWRKSRDEEKIEEQK